MKNSEVVAGTEYSLRAYSGDRYRHVRVIEAGQVQDGARIVTKFLVVFLDEPKTQGFAWGYETVPIGSKMFVHARQLSDLDNYRRALERKIHNSQAAVAEGLRQFDSTDYGFDDTAATEWLFEHYSLKWKGPQT